MTVLPRLYLFGQAFAHHVSGNSFPIIYDGYMAIAQSLTRHGVYGFDGVQSITTRAPLLPLLLIPGVALGLPVVWTFFLHLILSVASVLLLQSAATSFGASPRAAFLAGSFLALDPWFMLLARYGSTAITAVFLMTCLLWFLSRRQYALCGLSGGLIALCHPSCSLALLGILAADAIRRGWNGAFQRTLIALCMYVVVLSPWIARNYAMTGRVIAGVDGFGYQYLTGSSSVQSGKPAGIAQLRPLMPRGHDKVHFATADSVANAILDRVAFADLFDTLIHKPSHFLFRCGRQFIWFWVGDKQHAGWLMSVAHFIYLVPVLLGAGAAAWFRWNSIGALTLAIAPTILIHSVVVSLAAEAMYSLPVIPVLAVMTACVGEDVFRNRSLSLLHI